MTLEENEFQFPVQFSLGTWPCKLKENSYAYIFVLYPTYFQNNNRVSILQINKTKYRLLTFLNLKV